MPLPTKSKKESDSEFISKCVGDPKITKEFPDQKQRVAVCYSQLKQQKKKKQSKGSNESPIWEDVDLTFIIY